MPHQDTQLNALNPRELTATTRAVGAADDIAEATMEKFAWERKGLLGRLVRTAKSESLPTREAGHTARPA